MIDAQEDYSLRNMEYNLMYQGVKLDDYLSYIGTTREEYKKNFEEEARRTVLNQLIVEKIIEVEKITASAKEIEAKVKGVSLPRPPLSPRAFSQRASWRRTS